MPGSRKLVAVSSVIVAIMILVVSLGASFAYFGSLGAIGAWFRGDTLYVDNTTIVASPVLRGDEVVAEFRLTSLVDAPVTIIGSSAVCKCAIVEGLPLEIPSGTTRILTVRIKTAASDEGENRVEVRLYVNGPNEVVDLAVLYKVYVPALSCTIQLNRLHPAADLG